MHFGVQLGWLVDPFAETVSLYRPDQELQVLTRPSALSGDPELPGLQVDLTEVWSFVDEDAEESDD